MALLNLPPQQPHCFYLPQKMSGAPCAPQDRAFGTQRDTSLPQQKPSERQTALRKRRLLNRGCWGVGGFDQPGTGHPCSVGHPRVMGMAPRAAAAGEDRATAGPAGTRSLSSSLGHTRGDMGQSRH